jgi:Zn-dependent alcohol dehydrogenase
VQDINYLIVCLSSSVGAVWNTCKVEIGSTVAVFGLGTVVSLCQHG